MFVCVYNEEKDTCLIYANDDYDVFLITDDGPPSPESPKKQKGALPAYLEPTPQVYHHDDSDATWKIRPQLFHLLAPPLVSFSSRRATAPALTHQPTSIYSPLPRRSYSQSMDPIRPTLSSASGTGHFNHVAMTDIGRYPSTPSSSASSSPTTMHQQHGSHQIQYNNSNPNKKRKHNNSSTASSVTSSISPSAPSSPFQGQDTCTSPTLAAACTSAANMHKRSSSSSSPSSTTTHSQFDPTGTTHSRMNSNDDKKQVDQSMFLTKNAHIKRPRNAWIHVSVCA